MVQEYTNVRIRKDDYEELTKMSKVLSVPIVRLISLAVQESRGKFEAMAKAVGAIYESDEQV